ncbi:MAG: hypothetical protein AAF229_04085 [Pseudomonadota bacterium]
MTELAITLFHPLVVAHIATGTVGLITLWVPVVGRKGSQTHKDWGKIFAWSLMATGVIAVGISTCSLIAPLGTHPFMDDEALVRNIFGWMMLYLATMTVALAWYGLECIKNRREHQRHRNPLTLTLTALMFLTALNCFVRGVFAEQILMVGIAIVGLAAGILNTVFIYTDEPPPMEWMIQHSRGLVGAGISVYTAFLAFGAVNWIPAIALNPILWAVPCTLGIGYLLYHQFRITRMRQRRVAAA